MQIRAYTQLLTAQFAISSGGIMARFALAGMDVYSVGAWRFSLVAILLIARLIIKKRPLLPMRAEVQLMVLGFLLAQQFAAWMMSISYLTVGTATLLYCTTPLWNGLYEIFILRRRTARSFWCALALAGIGITLMVYDGASEGVGEPQMRILGIVLALSSGLGVSAYFILMRRFFAHDDTTKKAHDTLDLLTRIYTYAAVFLIGMSYFDARPVPPLSQWSVWAGVVCMAVITQGVGHTLQSSALRHIRASIVGFATLLEAPIATVLAAIVFHEAVGIQTGVGAVLVLGALAWALHITHRNFVKAADNSPVSPAAQPARS